MRPAVAAGAGLSEHEAPSGGHEIWVEIVSDHPEGIPRGCGDWAQHQDTHAERDRRDGGHEEVSASLQRVHLVKIPLVRDPLPVQAGEVISVEGGDWVRDGGRSQFERSEGGPGPRLFHEEAAKMACVGGEATGIMPAAHL